jgi:hypothetical protein
MQTIQAPVASSFCKLYEYRPSAEHCLSYMGSPPPPALP